MLPESLENDFHAGHRSKTLPFCVNDIVEVVAGPYSGRRGPVVALDRQGPKPRFLVDFEDGTDELLDRDVLRATRDG